MYAVMYKFVIMIEGDQIEVEVHNVHYAMEKKQ